MILSSYFQLLIGSKCNKTEYRRAISDVINKFKENVPEESTNHQYKERMICTVKLVNEFQKKPSSSQPITVDGGVRTVQVLISTESFMLDIYIFINN